MVGEIVDHRDLGHCAAGFEPTPNPRETPRSLECCGGRDTQTAGGRHCGQQIGPIVRTGQGQVTVPHYSTIQPNFNCGRLGRFIQHAGLPVGLATGLITSPVTRRGLVFAANALYRRPTTASQHANERLTRAIDNQSSRTWHRTDEMMELRLNRGEVRKDVGVVVLQIIQNRDTWPVMNKF